MGDQRLRLVLVEDHALVRAGLRALVEQADGIAVAGGGPGWSESAVRANRICAIYPVRMGGPSRLIIVSGAPASGKTRLAERLAADLGYPLLTKDLIKESLFDTVGSPDRVSSRQLSLVAYSILYRVVDRLIAAKVNLVMEGNFQRGISENGLAPLTLVSEAILIHCTAATEELIRRYDRRATEPLRHPGHHDGPLSADNVRGLSSGIYEPLELSVPKLLVDTTAGYDPHYAAILEFATGKSQRNEI